jgi:hypothetical protein
MSYHEDKDEIRHNVEAQLWKALGSEFALGVPMRVLELMSDGIRHFRRKKQTRATGFICDSRLNIIFKTDQPEGEMRFPDPSVDLARRAFLILLSQTASVASKDDIILTQRLRPLF